MQESRNINAGNHTTQSASSHSSIPFSPANNKTQMERYIVSIGLPSIMHLSEKRDLVYRFSNLTQCNRYRNKGSGSKTAPSSIPKQETKPQKTTSRCTDVHRYPLSKARSTLDTPPRCSSMCHMPRAKSQAGSRRIWRGITLAKLNTQSSSCSSVHVAARQLYQTVYTHTRTPEHNTSSRWQQEASGRNVPE